MNARSKPALIQPKPIKELFNRALLTSQIEGTQATLVDLFDQEAGFRVSNADDVEEVTNYLQAFRWTERQLRSKKACP